MDPDQLLARGVRLGGYEIVEPLGAGGMGAVYRAYDPRLNRLVALKVLNPGAVGSGAPLRRLEQEARAASALNHPGIVTIHDTGESEGRFYIVMELVEGTTLRQFLRRGPRPLRKALHIATQLAEALAKAHEAGVVHRDLKPENVMVTPDEHVKIVDFGLAKLTDRSALFKSEQDSATESGQGVIRGTVGYMAPEQVRGEPADARADQFAFGAILYELLSGSRAFQRSTSVETLSMILNEDPPEDTVITALPSSLRWLLDRCLAKDARDRYASTRDLALDLIALRDHSAELLRVDKRRVGQPSGVGNGRHIRGRPRRCRVSGRPHRQPWRLGRSGRTQVQAGDVRARPCGQRPFRAGRQDHSLQRELGWRTGSELRDPAHWPRVAAARARWIERCQHLLEGRAGADPGMPP